MYPAVFHSYLYQGDSRMQMPSPIYTRETPRMQIPCAQLVGHRVKAKLPISGTGNNACLKRILDLIGRLPVCNSLPNTSASQREREAIYLLSREN